MQPRFWSKFLLCTSLLLAAPASAQSVKAGIDAWQRGDYVGAVAIWRPLAEAGDPDASFNMGQAYRLGRGVLVDLATAQTWLERAAEKGHVDAQTTLGLLLFQNGNQADGLKWLKGAAEKGDAASDACLWHRALQWRRCPAGPGARLRLRQPLGRARAGAGHGTRSQQMDDIMPVEQRKKGVALAMQKAKTQQQTQPKPHRDGTTKSCKERLHPHPRRRLRLRQAAPGGSSSEPFRSDRRPRPCSGGYRASAPVAGRQQFLVAAGSVTRLQVGPFPSKSAAAAACSSLSARGQACFPVAAR